MVKRGIDLAVSTALLLFFLPIMAAVAVIVRATSPGPALFRQVRMGRGFKTFRILKFRTMAHAEGGLPFTLGPDARITRVGRWLRWSKLDELPQLWNVLRGEMSLVGPRPVIPDLTVEFQFYYRLLLRARPGMTDPASLKYRCEASLLEKAPDPIRYFKGVVTPDKIRISLEYMERATLWTDMGTLGMTALVCCFPGFCRVYGHPQNARLHLPILQSQPSSRVAAARLPSMESVTESLSFGETTDRNSVVEEVPRIGSVPWILLQPAGIQGQSTVRNVHERAS